MIIIKTPDQVEGIRKSSKLAAETLIFASNLVKPGVSTLDINSQTHQFIVNSGATPAPLGYQGFPKSTCISINNVVCHGIPSATKILREGDIVNIDVTTILNGFYGDTSATFTVGQVSPLTQKLISVTQEALALSIKSLKPGSLLNDCVGKVIQPFVEQNNFSVVRDLGGHGVGVGFHEDPFVFHFNAPFDKTVLQPGMTFTIEPMVNASTDYRITLDKADGWTIYTYDGSLSAQFEHTILITDTGYEILTK